MEQNQNRDFQRHVFNAVFLLTRHFSFSKSYPEIEAPNQPQSAGEESVLTRDIT